MMAADRMQEIRNLHERFVDQCLVFEAIRTAPDSEATLAETREMIMRIYSRIKTLTGSSPVS
jgi:hypothetical protein